MRILASTDSVTSSFPCLPHYCTEEDDQLAGAEDKGAHHGVVEYVTGIAPAERPTLPGYDDGVTALVTGVFMLLAISVSRHTNFLKTFASSLVSGRRRSNTFDDHTVDESRITAALLLVCCLCEGIVLYFAATLGGFSLPPFTAIAIGSAVAVALMLVQTIGYFITGYTFAMRVSDTPQWLRGFFASQSLLGLALILPALFLIFYPGAAETVVPVCAALYILARLLFIAKGFRFFYTNFFSLVYFILYLCTLEIAPLLFLWRIGNKMSGLL